MLVSHRELMRQLKIVNNHVNLVGVLAVMICITVIPEQIMFCPQLHYFQKYFI
jgi:hypothetical protein